MSIASLSRFRGFGTAIMACSALGASACATVHPYEREYLTRPGMDPQNELQIAGFESHVQSAREGAIGGRGTAPSTGGGCGCN